MSSQRNDSEYLGSSSQPIRERNDQDRAENSEFEKHDKKTDRMYCFFQSVVKMKCCINLFLNSIYVGEIL